MNRWVLIAVALLAVFLAVFWRDLYFLGDDAMQGTFRSIDPRTIATDSDVADSTRNAQLVGHGSKVADQTAGVAP